MGAQRSCLHIGERQIETPELDENEKSERLGALITA
jgi:hypothetical protein